ncbi:MAG: flagellar protein, FliL [Methanobrevibacter sp.]|nr:flagellar protein, FliL [Methanobrevibacter sp.]
MDTKDILIISLSIILAALIVVGVIFMTSDDNDDLNITNSSGNDNSSLSVSQLVEEDVDDSDVVSEEVKYNDQAGGGYYKEVTYRDGGFRQYDTQTGELIGSSYQSDQKYLPSME